MTISPATPAPDSLRSYGVTILLMVAAILVVGQLYAYLPLTNLIAERLGITASEAGLATTLFALCQAIGFLVFGYLNHYWRSRTLFAAGIAGLAAASLLTALALALGLGWGFMAGRALQGMTAAAFPPFAITMLIEATSERHRPTAIGLLSAALLMSAPLGQLMASITADTWSVPAVFLGVSVLLVPIALCLWQLPFGTTKAPQSAPGSSSIKRLLHWRTLGRFYVAVFVLLMGVVFYYAVISSGESVTNLQWFRLLGSPAVLMTLVSGALLSRVATNFVQAAGLILAASGALLSGFVAQGSGLYIGHWLTLGGIALATPAFLHFLGEQPMAYRQRAITLYTFILFCGASLGAPLAQASITWGKGIALPCMAGIYIISALLLASYRHWPANFEPNKSIDNQVEHPS
ncbi:MFS transporter [Vreelandella janggokensis]|uniref:MFS transporter n=1 Tax=Vreelandella janggokensis TaxID=370767 RepID=UPI00285AC985|nr:MFS transporter [Halomonas janggokensis]MDR5884792.1 MFS transporter [Halomonas janggokensis]